VSSSSTFNWPLSSNVVSQLKPLWNADPSSSLVYDQLLTLWSIAWTLLLVERPHILLHYSPFSYVPGLLASNLEFAHLRRASEKKTVQISFCHNFFKFPPVLISFGRRMVKRLKLCEVHSISTSPNSRHHTTVLNADVPNYYTMLKVVIFNKLSSDLIITQ